jgi:hypothetical protein
MSDEERIARDSGHLSPGVERVEVAARPDEVVRLTLRPCTLREANAFVTEHHRHHKASRGHRFSIAAVDDDGTIRGVVIVGRTVARNNHADTTAEVVRLCTDGARNACSMLYAAAWRAWKGMGGTRLLTYILDSEEGVSLRAAGWRYVRNTDGGSWDRPSRGRTDSAPIVPKQLWEAA